MTISEAKDIVREYFCKYSEEVEANPKEIEWDNYIEKDSSGGYSLSTPYLFPTRRHAYDFIDALQVLVYDTQNS